MVVNGISVPLKAPQTLREFLESQGYDPARVAVERNGDVVRRADFSEVVLSDRDTLEVVRFVGGG